MKRRFWQFVHNCVAHPLEGVFCLFVDETPVWIQAFHDWTATNAWRK